VPEWAQVSSGVSDYLKYSGGTAGAADRNTSPIAIGWVNQQGGPSDVGRGATKGAEMAVKYINAELGGIDGHPIELHTCFLSTAEEQGQTCGQKLANDDAVDVIAVGAVAIGAQSSATTRRSSTSTRARARSSPPRGGCARRSRAGGAGRRRTAAAPRLTAPGAARRVCGMAAGAGIRVLVGEDEPLVREGVVRVLEGAGFDVVGVAGDAEDLVRKANGHRPDLVVTDIQMPPDHTDDGLRAAMRIRERQPGIGVVVLSNFLEDRYALDLVGDRADGVGYLLKDRVGDLTLFVDALRRVARGGSALDPAVVERMVGRRRHAGPLDDLTPRERQVMALMAEGRSNQGIAEQLVVTVPAIERHVTGIFGKLGLRGAPQDHRRVLAVLEFLKRP
jgi:DNA-binding NarL/FixJ family response regulator